jgi:hypothetical protein
MGVGMVGPEVVEQVLIVIVIAQLIAHMVGVVAELLLPLGAAFATAIGQAGTHFASVSHTDGLLIAAARNSTLAIVGREVTIFAPAVTQIRSGTGAIGNFVRSVPCGRATSLQEIRHCRVPTGRSRAGAKVGTCGTLAWQVEKVIQLRW